METKDLNFWGTILGQEGKYQISYTGKVKSLPKKIKNRNGTFRYSNELILKNRLRSKDGYYFVSFYDNYKFTTQTIHRLVAMAFIPNPENKPYVNHIDGNKLNNHVSNLEWANCSENMLHAYRTGIAISQKGSKCHKSKMTESNVLAIRRLYKRNPFVNRRNIAKKFGVAYNTITCVILRKTWTHI